MKKSVVIVGAGVVGLACAHYLRRAGYQITVVEKGRIGGECSHANCGYICPSHVLPLTEPGAFKVALASLFKADAPFRVKPQARPELAMWMMQFAKRCTHPQMLKAAAPLKAILDSSMREYKRLVYGEGISCEFRELGLLYVLRSEAAMTNFAKTDQLLRDEFGVGATRIEGPDLPALDPALKEGLAGAFHYEGDCHLRPDLLNRNWAANLRGWGVTFIEDCEVTSVDRTNSSGNPGGKIYGLETSRGPLVADEFVFALGARSALFAKQLGCRIPIEPGKGYSVTMSRPKQCPIYPMLFPEHKIGVTPFKRGYRLGSMMEFAGFDASIPERRIEQLRRSAEPYLLEPHTEYEQERWYGWRPMTWDSLPIIGRVPGLANASLCTGHNMLGLSLAPASGRLLAEIVVGEAPHIAAEAFSPDRF